MMYKQFADAGYQMANCNTKTTKTWTDKTNPKALSKFTYPTDNILVYGIKMKWSRFDRTKLKHENGYPVDHIPVVAKLSTGR